VEKNLTLINNCSWVITLESAVSKEGKKLSPQDHTPVKNGAIIHDGQTILWVGKENTIPENFNSNIKFRKDMKGRVVTPGLIDCHTHLVFAGNRALEYVDRLNGRSYQDIADSGGGITYSSEQTNHADNEKLYQDAFQRLERLYQLGHCAVEIKSGYSLTLEGEINLCRIIHRLKQSFKDKISIHTTLMAAHAVPKNSNADSYLDDVVLPSLKLAAAEQLIDSVDIFHEVGYFNQNHVEKLFTTATLLNIPRRIHADEFNNNNGAAIAKKFQCLSADHLLHVDHANASILADSQTVATLLPGTAFFLGKKLAPAKMLLDTGCAVAIGSDYNPGSCHWNDVFQIARMSAASLGLNTAQFWCSITYNGARALALNNFGAIKPGFKPKFLVWEAREPEDLLYDWTNRQNCQFV